MPRRALVLITALVLGLHWLLLSGMPLAWHSPEQPSGRVFTTRSVTLAPPPAPAPPQPDSPAQATPAAAPAPKPPPRKKPAADATPPRPTADSGIAQAPMAPEPPGTAPDTPAAPDATDDVVASAAGATPASDAAPPPAAPASAASAASAAAAAPAAVDAAAAASGASGVDITPPGSGTGQASSTAPPPVRIPPPTLLAFEVSGQAKKFAYNARAELLWKHDGNRYEARQEVSAFLVGSRTQSSMGQIAPQGLLPERFADRARSEQAAHFDYAKGRVTFSANTPESPMGPGTQDRLSVFIQLGAMLAADPGRFVPGTQVTLTTVSARSADRWTFTVEGNETLDLPAGPTPALKLQRLPRKDYDQKAELWVAPALGYLPVRIRLTQANGDFADLRLRASSTP